MKKFCSILVFSCFVTLVQAQRNVDLEVVEMLSPTELNSTSSGTPIQVFAVLKNNGPDKVLTGDSIAYQIVLRTTTDQLIAAVPNGSLFTSTLTRDLANGDTMHFRTAAITLNARINPSANIKFQFLAIALNRSSSGLATESTSQQANNLLSKTMIWFNEQGWGVGIGGLVMDNPVEAHPNPASSSLRVNWLLNATESALTEISLTDLSGREVLRTEVPSQQGNHLLELGEVKAGLYLLEVRNGSHVHHTRVQVID